MKTVLITLVAVAGIASAGSAQEPANAAVEQAIRMAQNGRLDLPATDFAPYRHSALALLGRISEVGDDVGRKRLIRFVRDLEREALGEAKRNEPSDNKELLAAIVKVSGDEKEKSVCRVIASALRALFLPRELAAHKAALRALLDKACDNETLALYASIVDRSEKEEIEKALACAKELPERMLLSLKARWGTLQDATALMAALQQIDSTGFSMVMDWVEAASLADTEHVRKLLAEQLRTERIIQCSGGQTLPARYLYASILCRMVWGEKDSPVKHWSGQFSEAELDQIEKWAEQHLGVKHTGRRKPLYSRPGISR